MISVVMLICALRRADQRDSFQILFARVRSRHGAQHFRGARLHWQVYVVAQFRLRIDGRHDVRSKIARMRSGKAHAANSGTSATASSNSRKPHSAWRWVRVGIDGLAQHLHFGVTEFAPTPALRATPSRWRGCVPARA